MEEMQGQWFGVPVRLNQGITTCKSSSLCQWGQVLDQAYDPGFFYSYGINYFSRDWDPFCRGNTPDTPPTRYGVHLGSLLHILKLSISNVKFLGDMLHLCLPLTPPYLPPLPLNTFLQAR